MAEARSFGEKLYFIMTGIRLHAKEYFLRLTGLFNRYSYCLSFPSIPEGLKAEKELKGFKAVSVPIPDEIFKGCGVGILVEDERELSRLLEHLESRGVMVSGVFKREGGEFKEIGRRS